jgi:serine protease Do
MSTPLCRILAALAIVSVLVTTADARQWSWLGVRIRDLSEQETEEIAARHGIREGFGVVIVEVIEGTPAAKAGFRTGDIVVAIEERPVIDTRMLQRLIGARSPDQEIRLTVLRPDGRRGLPVKLVAMPREIVGERIAAEFGFVLRDPEAQPELGGRRPPGATPAVVVVMRGSAAERAGLEVGDVILHVNDQAVITRDAAREALADVAADRPLRLTVRRGSELQSFTLTAP